MSIISHATETAPAECCGLLLGRCTSIVEARPTRNAAGNPIRNYLIDPHEHFTIIREARRSGLEVLGAYHSHPQSRAVPSETDRAEGFSDFLFLIVGGDRRPLELSAWIWADGNFTEVPLVRVG
jgi:proteasome lid subunit RPN8/RPN11